MTIVKHIVVGISGASCSGKTTLTKLLQSTFPWANVVHQDIYYYPNDPKYHVYLPDVKHFNWDVKSAVDFTRMERDLQGIIYQPEKNNQKITTGTGSELNKKGTSFCANFNYNFILYFKHLTNKL